MNLPLTANLTIKISERDALWSLSPGYEDETGTWIDTYTEEEWKAAKKQATGKTFFLCTVEYDGQSIAMESGQATADKRKEMLVKLLEFVSECVAIKLMDKFPEQPELLPERP